MWFIVLILLVVILWSIENKELSLKNTQIVESVLNKKLSETHPDCQADCVSLNQFESIFPLHGDESKLDVPINKFSFKFIFSFSDHLSLYKDTEQKLVAKVEKPPKQSDFLNDYPIDSFLQPCRNGQSICYFQDYLDQICKSRKVKFEMSDEVKSVFGSEYNKKCILLHQELIQTADEVYVICHKDLEELTKMFFILNNLIEKQGQDDSAGRLFMLNENQNELQEMDIFLDQKVLTGNNKGGGPLDEVSQLPDFVAYFTFNIDSDLMSNCAYSLINAGDSELMQWKGDEGKKPQKERCFGLKLKIGDEKNNKRFFCVFTNSMGTKSLDAGQASLQAYEWTIKINKAVKKSMKKKTMQKISKKQELSAQDMNQLELDVHVKASMLDKRLKNLMTDGLKEEDEVKEIKKAALSELIDGLCGGDKKCMANIAGDIAGGKLPLTDEAAASAWSPDNPYKQAAAAKAENSQNQGGKGEDIRAVDGGQIQQIEATDLSSGGTEKAISQTPEGQITSNQVMNSINTFKFILQGKSIDDLDKNGPKFCEPEDPNTNLLRAIGLMPFLAKMDPWLEYLGYVRDIQSNAE